MRGNIEDVSLSTDARIPVFCGVCLWLQDDLPFEFKALELALELASSSLDSQVCLNSLIGYL